MKIIFKKINYNNYNFEIIINNKGHKLPHIIIDNEKYQFIHYIFIQKI